MLARHLREQLESRIDESLGALADLLTQARDRIRTQLPDLPARRYVVPLWVWPQAPEQRCCRVVSVTVPT